MRPLRFISRNPGMKIIVNSLIESLKEIINVAILIFYIWFFIKNLGNNLEIADIFIKIQRKTPKNCRNF